MIARGIGFSLFLIAGLLASGCQSRIVGITLDWNAPIQIQLLAGDREIVPHALEQRQFVKLLENAVPRMRQMPETDLETPFMLRLSGSSPEGVPIVRHFHLGATWIGSGGRIVVLTEAEARRLQHLVTFVVSQNEP